MQPVFGYPGGKSRAFKSIVKALDLDFDKYKWIVEPFCGGASFSLASGKSRLWLNDVDADLYCLWKAIKHHPTALCNAVRKAKITPEDFYRLQEKLLQKRPAPSAPMSLVSRALDKLIIHKISFSNMGEMSGSPVGGVNQTGKWKFDCRWNVESICKQICKASNLLIDSRVSNFDFDEVLLNTYPGDLCFIDPPYVEAGKKCYKHSFTMDEHKQLADLVKNLSCDWIVTYDSHPAIPDLYKGCGMYSLKFNYFMSSAYRSGDEMKKGEEILISNLL
jgi:DNA adenine methylase